MNAKNLRPARQDERLRIQAIGDIDREKTKDQLFSALSNHRRRFVLDYLQRDGSPSETRGLVEALAAWENDVEVSQTTSIQRKRAYVSLRQTHLPMLADMELIDYDPDRGIVDTGDRWELVEDSLPETVSDGQYRRLLNAILIGLAILGLGIGLGIITGL